MRPIHELFSRIRWDEEFGAAEFLVGYYDRVQDKIVRVPFRALQFTPGDHFSFQVFDEEGECHTVPLHRVRELRRNGIIIWRR
jgi:uncharacterized protein (UPF0248 family)